MFGFFRSLLFFNVLVSSAQTLHNRMFNAILRTPVHFFDINPIGKQLFLHIIIRLHPSDGLLRDDTWWYDQILLGPAVEVLTSHH